MNYDDAYIMITSTLPDHGQYMLCCESNTILDEWNKALGKAKENGTACISLVGFYPSHMGAKPRKVTLGLVLEFVKLWECVYKEETE